MPIENGDTIKVEYKGTLEDGTVFDSTEKHGEPLEFEVGGGQLISGFDQAVVGMEEGQEKDIKLPPSEAYGEPNPQLIHTVPKDQLPNSEKLQPGMMLLMNLKEGVQLPAFVTDATVETVTLDFNHVLAGKTLNFHIKIVEIMV